jgi:hypothetical protein
MSIRSMEAGATVGQRGQVEIEAGAVEFQRIGAASAVGDLNSTFESRTTSSQAPPWNASAPPLPISRSLPVPPTKLSAAALPVSVSASVVPRCVTAPVKLPPRMT